MSERECRHCRTPFPFNTLSFHGYCATCWANHEDGVLQLDGCHVVRINGTIQHRDDGSNMGQRHRGLPETPPPHQADMNSLTWLSVIAFACRMEYKLSLHRDRGNRPGWLAMSHEWLFARGVMEESEVAELLTTRPEDRDWRWAEKLANECADRANLLMMLADKATHDYPSGSAS